MKTVTLAPHEFHANLLYNDDGLLPFFACDSQVKQAGGSKETRFEHDGDQWRARLSYQSSNLVHPGSRTPFGTDWQLEEMREYRLKILRDPIEDEVGQQSFTAHVAPRWEGMKGKRDDGSKVDIPVPDGSEIKVGLCHVSRRLWIRLPVSGRSGKSKLIGERPSRELI